MEVTRHKRVAKSLLICPLAWYCAASESIRAILGSNIGFLSECVYAQAGLNVHFTITKTCLYNVDPLKPHFYIVKLGFIGVYIIFPQSMFWAEVWNILHQRFLPENFRFLEVKFSICLNRRVFVMTVLISQLCLCKPFPTHVLFYI